MGHSIRVIIAKDEVLARVVERFAAARSVPLQQGFSMIPATHALLDAIDEGCPAEQRADVVSGFVHLGGGLVPLLLEISEVGPVLYFETDYAGGTGTQAAATYINGHPALLRGPAQKIGAVSEALRSLGATRAGAFDEFEALGLHKYRSMSTWEE